jgi:hypothetical protein
LSNARRAIGALSADRDRDLGYPCAPFRHVRIAMIDIADVTPSEEWIVQTTLRERYGAPVSYALADAEIRLNPADRDVTSCPVIYWEHDGCNFILFKTGDRRYRCQFFFRGFQQYGTGVYEYDDLAECIVSLLQVQADYAARERGDIA